MEPTFEDVTRELGHTSFLEHVAAAASDANRWKDVVWKLLYEWQGISFEVEDLGQLLLDLGRDFPEYARSIGEAAQHLLRDPRVQEARRGESRHWLAMLAHEFASLEAAEMRDVLTKGEWISWTGARALMARLGSVPEGVPRRHRIIDYPEDLGHAVVDLPSTDDIFGRLMDWTRPAEAFHPETCEAIGQLLYSGQIKEAQLDELARQGALGIMVSETIRYCAGLRPSLSSRLALVLSGGPPYRLESDRPFQRLRYNVRRFHATYLEEDPAARQSYAAAVEEAMRLRSGGITTLASELLRLRGCLPVDQVNPVFEEFATHRGRYHDELALGIISWIITLQLGEDANAVRQAAEHAIVVLEQQGRDHHTVQFPPYAHLLFPVTAWVLGGKPSKESIEIYWDGIRLVFSIASGEMGIKRALTVMQDFDPLLAKVPQAIWASVREAGARDDNASVRTLIGMLGGFAGVLPQAVVPLRPDSPLGPPEPQLSGEESSST